MGKPLRSMLDLADRVAAISRATVAGLEPGDKVVITSEVDVLRNGFKGTSARYRIHREWRSPGHEARAFEVESGPMELEP